MPFWILVLFLGNTAALAQAPQKQDPSKKEAARWVKSRVWSDGLSIKPYPGMNNVEFEKQYEKNKAVWDKAFAFIKDHDLTKLAPGKYPIDGDNAFASITEGPSKTFEQSRWESHRKYIDFQYVITGKEKIGVASVATATVTVPYDEKADIAHYTADGKFYIANPSVFFLFFSNDAHRPNILVDGYPIVKKLVIKIKAS